MQTIGARVTHPRLSVSAKAIILGGLLAGAMDITAAMTVYGVLRGGSAIAVLQSVASGLLGSASYSGGTQTAALGLFLHFVIATTACAVYNVIAAKIRILARYAFLSGMIYGIVVWIVMSLVVVPLSNYPHETVPTVAGVSMGWLIHILCVGLPISLTHRKIAGVSQNGV